MPWLYSFNNYFPFPRSKGTDIKQQGFPQFYEIVFKMLCQGISLRTLEIWFLYIEEMNTENNKFPHFVNGLNVIVSFLLSFRASPELS